MIINKLKNNNLSENKLLIFASIVVFIYYLPYLILGENANIMTLDNLDSNITWVKILMDNNALFSNPNKYIPSPLNGLYVYNIYPYYDLSLVVFMIFGIYWGYVINKIIISFIGFLGMYLLLKKHFLPKQYSRTILVGTSLLYGLLPFWSFMASVSGLPFVLYAFLNIRKRNYSFHNWLIIILFAFYSSIVLSGVFLIIILVSIFLYEILKTKKINWPFLIGLFLIVGTYLISQFPVIFSFFEGEISHRVEFYYPVPYDFTTAIEKTLNILTIGQIHAQSLHKYIFFPIIILLFYTKNWDRKIKLIVVFIVLTSIIYGFLNFHYFKPIIAQITKIFPIQLQRSHFLHPMLWYILLAVVLTTLALTNRNGKIIAQSILIFQFIYIIKNHEIIAHRNDPTFKEFYSELTFSKIKQIIGKPLESYKVVSIGIHPSIAQYNGFYTLDGYFVQYPLSYKHQFRKVIEGEINRSEELKWYFDNWGSRCYAFSSELRRNFIHINRNKQIDSLNYNFEILKELGCSYIFSAYRINETVNHKLNLIDSVQAHKNYWKIYVYEIKVTNSIQE